MRRSQWWIGIIGMWLFLLGLPSAPYAATCESVASVGAGVWEQYRKTTEALGCQTKLGGITEYTLCGATRLVNESLEDMVGWWNSGAKNRWSTIGPRMLGAEIEYGTVVKLTKRTFVSMVPSFNKGEILVTGKKGKGKVTICATGDNGGTVKLYNDVEVNGQRSFSISRHNAEGKVLSVIVQSKTATFKYEIKKKEEPIKWNFGEIEGLSDLHVHGAAHLGFAGLWTWGDNDGPRDKAHKRCRALNVFDAASLILQIKGLPVLEKKKLHAIPLNWNKHEKEEVVRHGSGWSNGVDRYDDWPHFSDIAHQQVHTDWLKQAHNKGLKLVVMSAVNNELLCRALRAGLYQGDNQYACDDISNIERQLKNFNELDKKYNWYEIALTPWHARKIIKEGKLAVVLAAEASHMLPPSEGAFQVQLEKFYQLGLRSLQIVHERDNSFAGAAPHRSNFWWHQRTSNPLTSFKAMIEGDGEKRNPFDLDANGKNVKGLSKKGKKLIDAMIQRHMLIDVSHYSERTFQDVYNMVTSKKYKNYPLFNSHTRFKALLEEPEQDTLKEFLTTNNQIGMLKNVGGMVGVRTGPNAIATDPNSGVKNNCAGSSRTYAQLISYAKKKGLNVAFGSDFNGVTQQIGPRYGDERCYAAKMTGRQIDNMHSPESNRLRTNTAFDTDGLKHIGYLPDLYKDLKVLKTNGVEELNHGAENFIAMWERAYGEDIEKTVNSKHECQADLDCPSGKYCTVTVLNLNKRACVDKKPHGATCTKKAQCATDRCSWGFCADADECQANRDCRSNQYCGDPISGKRKCKNLLSKGKACTKASQCTTGRCSWGVCADADECRANRDCRSNQYCGDPISGKRKCKNLLSKGKACTKKIQCASGKCSLFRCK